MPHFVLDRKYFDMVELSNDNVRAIHLIRQYIIDTIPQRVKVEQLVAMSGMSATRLTRGFKFLFQVTIHQFWLEASMEYAAEKIRYGAMTKEIAISLGYRSTSTFARAFTDVLGYNPAAIKGR